MKLSRLLIAALFLFACAPARVGPGGISPSDVWPDRNMGRYHDDQLKVTCWVYSANNNDAAMTCIPDWQLTKP